jgi:hypothetical protein
LATIQAAKNQLQAKLDEAQWRLQAERGAKVFFSKFIFCAIF